MGSGDAPGRHDSGSDIRDGPWSVGTRDIGPGRTNELGLVWEGMWLPGQGGLNPIKVIKGVRELVQGGRCPC